MNKLMDKYKRTSFNLILQLSSFLISVVANLIITPMIVNQIGKELYGYVDLRTTLQFLQLHLIQCLGVTSQFLFIKTTYLQQINIILQ